MGNNPLSIIILAAGKGTRMKSAKAKVLHEVHFVPMVQHVVNAVLGLAPQSIAVVVGHQREAVQVALEGYPVSFCVQERQLGTGHAVLVAESMIDAKEGDIMILCGDTPLVRSETLAAMYAHHRARSADLTLMTTTLDDPTNYGRVLTDAGGGLLGIIEQKDATPEQLLVNRVNAGIYCVRGGQLFPWLHRVGTDNAQGEVYLTDILALAVEEGAVVTSFTATDADEVLGVNSRVELAKAEREMSRRCNVSHLAAGVSMIHPESIRIAPQCRIGNDTLIESNATIVGATRIGSNCRIGQGSIIKDCRVGDDVEIGAYNCLTGIDLADGSRLGDCEVSGDRWAKKMTS